MIATGKLFFFPPCATVRGRKRKKKNTVAIVHVLVTIDEFPSEQNAIVRGLVASVCSLREQAIQGELVRTLECDSLWHRYRPITIDLSRKYSCVALKLTRNWIDARERKFLEVDILSSILVEECSPNEKLLKQSPSFNRMKFFCFFRQSCRTDSYFASFQLLNIS